MHTTRRSGEWTTTAHVVVPSMPQPLMPLDDDAVGAPFWRTPGDEEQTLEFDADIDDTATAPALLAVAQPTLDEWPWLHSWHMVWAGVSACTLVLGMILGILLATPLSS